jgi:hypothetical protein
VLPWADRPPIRAGASPCFHRGSCTAPKPRNNAISFRFVAAQTPVRTR